MNLRNLSIIAFVLALGAIGAWLWFGEGTPSPAPDAPRAASSSVTEPARQPAAVPPAQQTASPESQPPPSKPAEPVRTTSAVVPGMPLVRSTPAPSAPVVAAAPGPRPPEASSWQTEGKADLEGVQFMLRDFRTRIGENPVGSNAEIMKAVMGGNEAKARLGPPPGQNVNDNGELVDRWGTPYFFHQLSKNSMEIRSAGPDGRLWTADDLVTK